MSKMRTNSSAPCTFQVSTGFRSVAQSSESALATDALVLIQANSSLSVATLLHIDRTSLLNSPRVAHQGPLPKGAQFGAP